MIERIAIKIPKLLSSVLLEGQKQMALLLDFSRDALLSQ